MGTCDNLKDEKTQINNYLCNDQNKTPNNNLEICINEKFEENTDNFIDLYDMIKTGASACQIKTSQGLGTGVFCYIPKFLYCLITCEHIITEEMIKNKETIIIIYNKINKIGRITKKILLDKRNLFYFKRDIDLDITIVELFPGLFHDGIEKERFLEPFFLKENENLNDIIKKNNFILLQHPAGVESLKVDYGNIIEINKDNNSFKHTINTMAGSSGGPILYKDNKNNYLIFGIHNKGIIKKGIKINQGTILYKVLNRFKKIIYNVKEKGIIEIFGKNFVINNKNNIELLINGEKQNLTETYYFDKIGENEVYIIENFYITDMSYMFFYNKSIITLESLRNWDVSKVKDMSCMFSWCKSIESLEPLKNWDVSKVEYMNCMFYECEFIKSLEPLQNWDVSNVQYMKDMFKYCKSIDSVEPLKNWNVSNVKHMESIFSGCELIKSFDSISNWCDLTSSFSISQITSKSIFTFLLD